MGQLSLELGRAVDICFSFETQERCSNDLFIIFEDSSISFFSEHSPVNRLIGGALKTLGSSMFFSVFVSPIILSAPSFVSEISLSGGLSTCKNCSSPLSPVSLPSTNVLPPYGSTQNIRRKRSCPKYRALNE